ncbi:myosin IA heavy chain, partial [Planoprotostelium fungivorum]
KVFLRTPQTLFDVEERRVQAFHRIATVIQAVWRSWKIRKVYIELRNESLDVFKGQKERNRMSMVRGAVSFFGDFLGLQNTPTDLGLLQPSDNRKILFSDRVNKINQAFKIQPRGLVLGEANLYNIKFFDKPKKNGTNFEVRRFTPISEISHLSVSRLADNYLVVHVPSTHDYVMETAKKTIFITLLRRQYKKITGKDLELKILESIAYKVRKGREKNLNFTKDENVVGNAQTKKSGNVLNVKISSGLNK